MMDIDKVQQLQHQKLIAARNAALVDAAALYEALKDLLAQAEHYNESWSVPQFLSDEPAVATARLALLAHNGAQPATETTEQMVERMR
jgi:hypothetical protein